MFKVNAPLAYDVGMHNGDDSEYYLAKGWNVVAIDANQGHCEAALERFSEEVRRGSLIVLNLGVGSSPGSSTFFVNNTEDAISTFYPIRFADENWVVQQWTASEIE